MNNLNNQLINLEEARNILKFAKRLYRALDGVEIEYGDVFAYYPNELIITIPEEFDDIEQGMNILKHVNKEFNATFEYNLREMSIQALCHEMGHHVDFEGKFMTNRLEDYLLADSKNRQMYDNICSSFGNKVRDYFDRLETYEAYEEVDKDIELELENERIELQFEDNEIDKLYRMIPTEYAADEFSARFFMTYLRAYKKCNYSL